MSKLILSLFPTSLGWFGLLGDGVSVHRVEIGHRSAASLHRRVAGRYAEKSDWCPALRSRLEDYAAGDRIDFSDVTVVLPPLTDFQFRVMDHVRQIGYGRTESYGEVATGVGSPGAARAVGSVMANNPVPILVPCHRVIAATGRLGGFSAPQGTRLKARMLALEASDS
ncbi:MAG: hypothetical protein CMJ65_12355 [Planctomycetaceae bacterium]|jgi:methylated-DNA-[protein]-cysteine S-methyltransferase|nr:hypothetical protein [Planctomycetaceae bacterium]MDP7275300.1 methylated-DNA--[protein]-cysteine S-methyltransferase [Planctomycetaceae bacterium]